MSCTKQTSKKYTERKSPPYKAEECPGDSKKGNDGLMWKWCIEFDERCY